jgi:hypothetical protein
MVSVEGDPITDAEEYIRHLAAVLPSAYLASKDMHDYRDLIRRVATGEVTPEQAAMKSPVMKRRKESVCPCAKGVRWVDTDGIEQLPQAAASKIAKPGTPAAGSPGLNCP